MAKGFLYSGAIRCPFSLFVSVLPFAEKKKKAPDRRLPSGKCACTGISLSFYSPLVRLFAK